MASCPPETRVTLFGQFNLQYGEKIYQHLESSKALELFCYLLINRASPQSREGLSVLLWGDSPTDRSKKNLRQALWQLQAILRAPAHPVAPAPQAGPAGKNANTNGAASSTNGASGSTNGASGRDGGSASASDAACAILSVDSAWVRVNQASGLWIDVGQFEDAYAASRAQNGFDLNEADAQCLVDAVQLYQGDLLEGWYQDWCLFERERLQNMFFEMLEKLMGYCEAHEQYEEGAAFGARILRRDRARERTYRSLMRLYFLAGSRTEALRQYERCETALREELGVEPSQSTKDLRRKILAEDLHPLAAPPETPSIPVTGLERDRVISELADQLRRMRASMTEMEAKLEENIRLVEKLADSKK